jgi:hypothetical protein
MNWLDEVRTRHGNVARMNDMAEAEALIWHWIDAFPEVFNGRAPAAIFPKEPTCIYDVDLQVAMSLLGLGPQTTQRAVELSLRVLSNGQESRKTALTYAYGEFLLWMIRAFDCVRVLSLWGIIFCGTDAIMRQQLYRMWVELRPATAHTRAIERRLLVGVLCVSLDPYEREKALAADLRTHPPVSRWAADDAAPDPEVDGAILDAMNALRGTDARGGMRVWLQLLIDLSSRFTLAPRGTADATATGFGSLDGMRQGATEQHAEVVGAFREVRPLESEGAVPVDRGDALARSRERADAHLSSLIRIRDQAARAKEDASDAACELPVSAWAHDPEGRHIHDATLAANPSMSVTTIYAPGKASDSPVARSITDVLARIQKPMKLYSERGADLEIERWIDRKADPLIRRNDVFLSRRRQARRTRVLLIVDVSDSVLKAPQTRTVLEGVCTALCIGLRRSGMYFDLMGFSKELYRYADGLPPLFRGEVQASITSTCAAIGYAETWSSFAAVRGPSPVLILTDGMPSDGTIQDVHDRLNQLGQRVPTLYGVVDTSPGFPLATLSGGLAKEPHTRYSFAGLRHPSEVPRHLITFLTERRIL